MGWTSERKPENVKKYLEGLLTWEGEEATHRCIASSLRLTVGYFAVETIVRATGKRSVWAAVFLIRYSPKAKDGHTFYSKSITESCGPVESDCPDWILDLLTDTDSEYAIKWRERCRRRNEKLPPKFGSTVAFSNPVTFCDGSTERVFTVLKHGRRKVLRGQDGGLYRLPARSWKDREWRVIASL